ncbi:allophanate hydrolase [Salinarimonas sp.]|uniref:allophanate hydrolase n=1 Tax=Salinarimonas sp. TaxID=2766526 RepID=UPI00391D9F87
MRDLGFDLRSLAAAYADGADPRAVAAEALRRARHLAALNAFVTLCDEETVQAQAEALVGRDRASLPLYGVPFAVKDNIDVLGMPTTAGCPEFAFAPSADAPVVQLLREAGAILVGKTNLDQFATGLVGARSPYGPGRNPFDPAYVSGGSSSGSAIAVSCGAVGFALGTDTAGSGRVPASFCNIVGWKGTRGLVTTRGVLPACRSLDVVSVFALTCDDAAAVARVASRYDAQEPFSRKPGSALAPRGAGIASLRLGVPRPQDLAFFDDPHNPALFEAAIGRFREAGARLVEIDLAPFLEAARLLYEGAFVAERTAAVGRFLAEHPDAGHPTVRAIVEGGRRFSAVDAYEALYRLHALARATEPVWSAVDAILTPTAGTIPTIAAVEAEPIARNSELGYYTNFMNLLDLSAIAIPAGFRPDGLPFGVTLFAPAFRDGALLEWGAEAQAAAGLTLGATGAPLPERGPLPAAEAVPAGTIPLAVFGAHMEGLALSHELTRCGARLLGAVRTAPVYRLFALEQLSPPRPGLVRDEDGGGAAIAGELWSVPEAALGPFVAGIPAPLAIGKVELAEGRRVTGFLCETAATRTGRDITALGGWRAYLARG